MTTAGIRELRQRASELLRLVEQGETIEITDRGRPVAVLAPLPERRTGLAYLEATGQIEPATQSWDTLPPPIELPPGSMTGSQALAMLRRDER